MAMALAVDREQARMLVATHGYEEAAKLTGMNSATLRQWAKRFKWHIVPTHAKTVVTRVTETPANALQHSLADHSKRSKLGFARAGSKVAEHLAEQEAETLLLPHNANGAKAWASTTALACSWDAQNAQQGALDIQVLSGETAIRVRTRTETTPEA